MSVYLYDTRVTISNPGNHFIVNPPPPPPIIFEMKISHSKHHFICFILHPDISMLNNNLEVLELHFVFSTLNSQ